MWGQEPGDLDDISWEPSRGWPLEETSPQEEGSLIIPLRPQAPCYISYFKFNK